MRGTHLVPPNKYQLDAANLHGIRLKGTSEMRGASMGAIGRVSREIEGQVWGYGANGIGHGGGLEKHRARRIFESDRQ
jgi:hypothetical protein